MNFRRKFHVSEKQTQKNQKPQKAFPELRIDPGTSARIPPHHTILAIKIDGRGDKFGEMHRLAGSKRI